MIQKVYAIQSSTPAGMRVIAYAASLAKTLKAQFILLYAWNEYQSLRFAGSEGLSRDETERTIEKNVRFAWQNSPQCGGPSGRAQINEVQGYQHLNEVAFENDSIVVSPSTDFTRVNANVLYPFNPSYGLNPTKSIPSGNESILIPFGDRESGTHTVKSGVRFAKASGFKAIFYHTTWRNPEVASNRPTHHMNPQAKLVWEMGKRLCDDLEVEFENIIEQAEHVTDGISRTALIHNVSMIAATRDENILRGDYTLELLERRLTPVIIFGEGGLSGN